jgi:hypothetical protein
MMQSWQLMNLLIFCFADVKTCLVWPKCEQRRSRAEALLAVDPPMPELPDSL